MPAAPSPDAPSAPTRLRTAGLATLALLAFAGNSLLCRAALAHTDIDPASFTAIRILSGAMMLVVLLAVRPGPLPAAGSWRSAAALFVYALAFSYAYTALSAGTGALLLFGAVQATMLVAGLLGGTRWRALQALGLGLALAGLVGLLWPGLSAPPLTPALLMLAAGAAWGIYTLRGRGLPDALAATTGNFMRAAPLAVLAAGLAWPWLKPDFEGALLALASGALTSGLGYAIWYAALRGLSPQSAGSAQLSVPVITALAGVLLLGEAIDLRLALGSLAVLGGIALTLDWRRA
ncbi:MAG TPA: DMT family transporter [Arenimonas sp.]|uniref:DMT family transporter n=1 Tax=Arenimonas sp. TaxID=1872635 RepID=UPI002D804F04|nr:DMT family transporter [Arenimonas sp.]HEU0152002.1 DMT family transporter [Arenimonas sp.]